MELPMSEKEVRKLNDAVLNEIQAIGDSMEATKTATEQTDTLPVQVLNGNGAETVTITKKEHDLLQAYREAYSLVYSRQQLEERLRFINTEIERLTRG